MASATGIHPERHLPRRRRHNERPVESDADNIDKIIDELATTKTSERAGRAQDHHERNAMQKLRAKGFM